MSKSSFDFFFLHLIQEENNNLKFIIKIIKQKNIELILKDFF